MKKNFLVIILAGLIFGSAFLPAQAFEIVIQPNGTVGFYNSPSTTGQVLGEKDETSTEKSSTELTEQQRRELRAKAEVIAREAAAKRREMEQEKQKPLRPVLNDKNTEIRVKAEGDKARVFLETKRASESGRPQEPRKEEVKSDNKPLRMEIPAQVKVPELKKDEKKEVKTPNMERVLQERNERKDEKLELTSTTDETGEAHLELKSRETNAEVKNAEVHVNPRTNEISLSSRSGQLQKLNHLPDQALTRIQEHIEQSKATATLEPNVQIETKDDGSVVYSTESIKMKKLFGLFNREVHTKVELNDSTGEVSETELPQVSAWGRFLNRFSR